MIFSRQMAHDRQDAATPTHSPAGRRFIIITGLSGAGKSTALRTFEDAGYYCIDNLPPHMMPGVAQMSRDGLDGMDRVVVVMDMRGRRYFGRGIEDSLREIEDTEDWDHRIIFVEADDATLVSRYKESRRPHPAARNGDVLEGIRTEREALAELREIADVVVNTSGQSVHQIRASFQRLARDLPGRLTVSLTSFGFKHGAPLDVDMLLDVRFLPNPHYDPDLRPLTGHDEPVRKAVLDLEDTREFLRRTEEMLEFLLPRYAAEGKAYLSLGIGCTGGRHRSVAISEELAGRLRAREERLNLEVHVRHRDIARGS
jgi:RNase adapter protein RapZ